MAYDFDDLKRRMEGALNAFSHDLSGLRTGRAATSLVDQLPVDAYGSMMPLSQLASVNVPEPRLITVQVWDASMAPAVEKAIGNSNLGLNPSREGQLIRLNIPDLTEERRKELVKVAASYAEKARIAVRNVRRDGMESLKKEEKDGEISQDEARSLSDDVQKLTDEYVAKVDDMLKSKESDILG